MLDELGAVLTAVIEELHCMPAAQARHNAALQSVHDTGMATADTAVQEWAELRRELARERSAVLQTQQASAALQVSQQAVQDSVQSSMECSVSSEQHVRAAILKGQRQVEERTAAAAAAAAATALLTGEGGAAFAEASDAEFAAAEAEAAGTARVEEVEAKLRERVQAPSTVARNPSPSIWPAGCAS